MENEPIISVKNIGKKYNITHQQGGYVALRDVLANVLKNPFKFVKQKTKEVTGMAKKEEFWALRDVNFEVKKGEVVGIIGKNGAGKSTLLKILSQITPPSEGEIKINGRVGSLLEVGTGFHPELSGRENIFLNGAILGMTKKEIARKFDEIVAFSGIEKFLDTPVKRYSSGMYVRLAFSVAAHMDPDILIIDEVLAVGDAEFQKKCLGKMDDITKKEGRTILFVSHNMGAIQQLCDRTIFLEKGKVISDGLTAQSIERYLSATKINLSEKWENKGDEYNNEHFKPEKLYLSKEKDGLWLNVEATIGKTDHSLAIGYALYSENGTLVYWSFQTDTEEKKWPILKPGKCLLKTELPEEILNSGTYKIELLGNSHFKDMPFAVGKLNPTIIMNYVKKFDQSIYWTQKRPGVLAPTIKWDSYEK
jgi:lipopolysaccharide transport system ATP-binding protein